MGQENHLVEEHPGEVDYQEGRQKLGLSLGNKTLAINICTKIDLLVHQRASTLLKLWKDQFLNDCKVALTANVASKMYHIKCRLLLIFIY